MPEPRARKSTVSPHEPEDWPHLFEQCLNAAISDAVMALYESAARFVARSGETLAGHDWIREVLGGMIAEKTRLHSRVVKSVTVLDRLAQEGLRFRSRPFHVDLGFSHLNTIVSIEPDI
jgi:hypothetical protein